MPISLRAAALRTALERAVDEPVRLHDTGSRMRIYATAPAPRDPAWPRIFEVLRSADRWGSTDAHDVPEIWAEVNEG